MTATDTAEITTSATTIIADTSTTSTTTHHTCVQAIALDPDVAARRPRQSLDFEQSEADTERWRTLRESNQDGRDGEGRGEILVVL